MPATKNALFRYKILDGLLKSRTGYTVSELTDFVNKELSVFQEDDASDKTVSSRMIRMDLENMMEIYPIQITKKEKRYYYESSDDSIDNINLSEQDKTAISLAVGVFARFNGTPLYEKFSESVTRIMANSVIRKINTTDTRKYVQVAEAPSNSGVEWLETIYNAIVDKKALLITYKSYGKKVADYVMSPYMLKEFRNNWYMIAYRHDSSYSEKTLVYKLNRIQEIKESNVAYYHDPLFNGEKYFKYTLGVYHMHNEEPINVKLKLHGKFIIQSFSEDKIHATQELIPISENEATLEMRVYDSPELATLILGYGEQIEVLEPEVLKNKIKERLNKASLLYP
jgi:predicted DNA-binding transcriptional regulator YafY